MCYVVITMFCQQEGTAFLLVSPINLVDKGDILGGLV